MEYIKNLIILFYSLFKFAVNFDHIIGLFTILFVFGGFNLLIRSLITKRGSSNE